jgi:hypothetical protein
VTVTSYYDSNWGGDLDSKKSTTGYVFILGSIVVNCSNKRQPTIVLSITEVEYMVVNQVAKKTVWL